MLRTILKAQLDFLRFRTITPDLQIAFWPHLLFILGVSWLVGVGRYWDHPSADWWQYAGLGSVAYVLVLSTVLFLVVAPLRPARWSFKHVLIFVGLTALPGLLYAIPVERFMSLGLAQAANAWFLAIVAAWRVGLYVHFLRSYAGLPPFAVTVATVLPLSGIVFSLALLNLEHVVFDIMAGVRPEQASPNDTAYTIVFLLTLLSYLALPATAVSYIAVLLHAWLWKKPKRV